jgi:hypothetical protein
LLQVHDLPLVPSYEFVFRFNRTQISGASAEVVLCDCQ